MSYPIISLVGLFNYDANIQIHSGDAPINQVEYPTRPEADHGQSRKLWLGELNLEKTAALRKTSHAEKEKDKCEKIEALLHSELRQAALGQPIPSIRFQDSPLTPSSYKPSYIAPLGASADTLNHWPSHDCHHRITHTPPAVPTCSSLQTSVSPLNQPKVSHCYQGLTPVPSTVPDAIELPFVQHRVSAKDLEFAVQKSTLSVLTCRGLPSPRVDKQYRYSKISPPLTDRTQVQRRRWTCSPQASFRKATTQPTKCSRSKESNDPKIMPPPARKNAQSATDSKDDLIHLPAPIPTSAYLDNARAIPNPLPSPQRLLLVLDLNGTLLYRPRASQNYTPRPYLINFLQYAFANHSLLVWSSAQPCNVKGVCTRLFSRDQRRSLLGVWGRDTLGLTSTQYKERVQVYKRLDRIWGNTTLQRLHPDFEGGKRWGQNNSVLIDDSALKASAQPYNHVKVPRFAQGADEKGGGRDVLKKVVGYLEEARKWSDVSGFVRHTPFATDDGWRWLAKEATIGT